MRRAGGAAPCVGSQIFAPAVGDDTHAVQYLCSLKGVI